MDDTAVCSNFSTRSNAKRAGEKMIGNGVNAGAMTPRQGLSRVAEAPRMLVIAGSDQVMRLFGRGLGVRDQHVAGCGNF